VIDSGLFRVFGNDDRQRYRQLRKELNFHEPISPENTANAGNES
jgi:hypothetical protein